MSSKAQTNHNPEHLLALGNEAYQRKDLAGSKRYFRRCLELNSDFIAARFNLGVVCSDLDQWAEAHRHLEQVIAQVSWLRIEVLHSSFSVICQTQDAQEIVS